MGLSYASLHLLFLSLCDKLTDKDNFSEDKTTAIKGGNTFPEWLLIQLIFGGLELVNSHTENSCTVSYYRHFSMSSKMKNNNINVGFVTPGLLAKPELISKCIVLLSAKSCL